MVFKLENTSVLVSARSLKIEAASGLAYGLHPEIAWNEGVSLDQQFRLFGKRPRAGLFPHGIFKPGGGGPGPLGP